jgi:hypothetical protein
MSSTIAPDGISPPQSSTLVPAAASVAASTLTHVAECEPAPSPTVSSVPAPARHRLPLKTIKATPSDELRARILAIAVDTCKPCDQVLLDLLALAAGIKVPWVIVRPVNGAEAGTAMTDVAKKLAETAMVFRDRKGDFIRHGTPEQAASVTVMYRALLELWANAQRLCAATFYDEAALKTGRDVCKDVEGWLKNASKRLDEELGKNEKADQKIVVEQQRRMAQFQRIIVVLARLGFGADDRLP